jgi:CheY-like chemotaxis protein
MIQTTDILAARILVVDDLEANVLLLERMLRATGYTCVESRPPIHARSASFTAGITTT